MLTPSCNVVTCLWLWLWLECVHMHGEFSYQFCVDCCYAHKNMQTMFFYVVQNRLGFYARAI